MQDSETQQPKAFGFVEYEDAEGVIRALGLLNNLDLDGQNIILKPNTATQVQLAHHCILVQDVQLCRTPTASRQWHARQASQVITIYQEADNH